MKGLPGTVGGDVTSIDVRSSHSGNHVRDPHIKGGRMPGRRTYHHGDLRNALLMAAMELVRERGTRGFSVIEAARRAGVSPSAPYRHFADRDALLAAAALNGFRELSAELDELPDDETLGDGAARIAVHYLRFAREDHARFQVMFAAGIDKAAHGELVEEAARPQRRLTALLVAHGLGSEAPLRGAELWALAHGVAALVVEGGLAHVVGEHRFEDVAANAARAWAAGVVAEGREQGGR
jgi:AcrR family transcriptional regulator